MYQIMRRRKKIKYQKLDEYAESQLVYRVYHTWMSKYQSLVKLKEAETRVLELEKQFLKKRAFNYWKSSKLIAQID